MSELEERLNSLLCNPQLMQQIASMAQAMGSEPQNKPPEQSEPQAAPLPSFDPRLLQTMAQTMGQSGIDSNQKSLLQASNGAQLQHIASTAAAGNLEDAKQKISSLLNSKEAQDLLKQLEKQV